MVHETSPRLCCRPDLIASVIVTIFAGDAHRPGEGVSAASGRPPRPAWNGSNVPHFGFAVSIHPLTSVTVIDVAVVRAAHWRCSRVGRAAERLRHASVGK